MDDIREKVRSKIPLGYDKRDPISHRQTNVDTLFNRFKSNVPVTYRGTKIRGRIIYGLGHAAGKAWADEKQIDPNSPERRYSKNSPSFDEGVWQSKAARSNS